MTVLIIGAGPAGLALAACLKRRGVPIDLVDRSGEVGGAYRHIYAGVTLQSPARYTSLPGLTLHWPREYITAPAYHAYLQRYAAHHGLRARQATVTRIDRQRSGLVQFDGEERTYAAVAIATGMYDFPTWPSIPGLPAQETHSADFVVMHNRHWSGPALLAGRRLLVIGGATGAVEIAEECAEEGLPVVVSARSGIKASSPRFLGRDVHDFAHVFSHLWPRFVAGWYCDRGPTLPAADLGFTRLLREGKIDVRGPVERFDGKRAHFADGRREDFDLVVAATGYRFDMPFLPADVPRAAAGHPLADDGECRSWPGLYCIGIPCCRSLVSEFLRGIAKDAPAIARRIAQRCFG